MIVIQFFLAMIYMLLIPYLIGRLCLLGEKQRMPDTVAWTMAIGLLVSYAIYEVIALFFIRLDLSFRLLSAIYAICICFLAMLGAVLTVWPREVLNRDSKDVVSEKQQTSLNVTQKLDVWFIAGIILIVVQILAIIILATPDKDDAFYSGLSSICLAQDSVLKTDAYTGLLVRGIGKRYAISALPAYQATLSLLTNGMHHLIITHNLFPLFYMPFAYALLYSIGKDLLPKDIVEKQKGKVLFSIALLHMIGNYYVFSPENFLVTRIWQGKALFVTFGIPAIWWFTSKTIAKMNYTNAWQIRNWFFIMVSLLGITFMGETGLYLGPFMLICICMAHAINSRRLKHMLPAVISCIPNGLLLLYLILM